MIYPDTIERLSQAFTGSLRGTARVLGLPEKDNSLLSDIMRGVHANVSRDAENRVRSALGLPPIIEHVVPACPSCGGVHTGDCHGKPVVQVVILAAGEGVRRARKPPERWVDCATAVLRQALEQRQPYTGSRCYDRAGRMLAEV